LRTAARVYAPRQQRGRTSNDQLPIFARLPALQTAPERLMAAPQRRWRLVREDEGPPSVLPRGACVALPQSGELSLGRYSFFAADADAGALTLSKALLSVGAGGRVRVTGSTAVFLEDAPGACGAGARSVLCKGAELELAPGAALLLQWGPPAAPRFLRLRLLEVEAEEAEAAPACAAPAQKEAAEALPLGAAAAPARAKRAASPADDEAPPEAKRGRPEAPAAPTQTPNAASAAGASAELFQCQVCCDDLPRTKGAACAEGHFVCVPSRPPRARPRAPQAAACATELGQQGTVCRRSLALTRPARAAATTASTTTQRCSTPVT